MKVRFSILIPAYNREKYIGQAVNSVLCQSFKDYETFVINDGSTDRTMQRLQSYGSSIRILQQTNRGPEVARNNAAALAQGEYLVFLDSDDLLLPHALEVYDRIIHEFDFPPLIIGSMMEFDDGASVSDNAQSSLPIKVLNYRDYLSKDVKLPLSSSRIVLRRSVFNDVGGLRNTTAKTFHLDSLNLILKVATYSPCIVVRQPWTVAYRHHEANAIRNLGPITDGLLLLARSEREGQYPGGRARRRDRYACIGGVALSWAVGHCWRAGEWMLGLRLLRGTAAMGIAAVWKKLFTRLRKRNQAVVVTLA